MWDANTKSLPEDLDDAGTIKNGLRQKELINDRNETAMGVLTNDQRKKFEEAKGKSFNSSHQQ